MKVSIHKLHLSIISFLFFAVLSLGACTEYKPPFTHYLNPEMDFASVQHIAASHGYEKYCEVSKYKGYCLLNFEKTGGGDDVFLVVNEQQRPVLRTFGFGEIDNEKLVHFVDDFIKHQPEG